MYVCFLFFIFVTRKEQRCLLYIIFLSKSERAWVFLVGSRDWDLGLGLRN